MKSPNKTFLNIEGSAATTGANGVLSSDLVSVNADSTSLIPNSIVLMNPSPRFVHVPLI